MSNYFIFIDESGNFQKTKDRAKDFVGGFVSKDFSYEIAEKNIKEATDRVNNRIEDKTKHFDYNKHMHFVPLHIKDDKRRIEEDINFPEKLLGELVSGIFTGIENKVQFTFRSKGFVKYFYDPETVYTNILRSTLFQVIQEIKENDKDDQISINICIASKKAQERDYRPDERFVKSLLENIKEELAFFDNIKFNLEIKRANDDTGLRIADFFCGALRDQFKNYGYLRKFKIIEFPVKHFSYNINDALTTFETLYQNNDVSAIMWALEILTNNKNNKLEEITLQKAQEILKNNKNEIFEEIDNTLYQFVILSKDKYTKLDFYRSFIETIKKYIHSDNDQAFNKKIDLITQKYSVKLASHTGQTDLQAYYQYLENLKINGYLIYKTRYLLLQEMLDNVLRAVPISFNSFNFQIFEKQIEEEYKNYNLVISEDKDCPDENMAKLEGTNGQIYAFLSDMSKFSDKTKSLDYFEISEMYLTNSLKYCVPGTESWKKAIGYLISLYFKHQDLNNCIKYFNLLTNNNSINKIYNLIEMEEHNNSGFSLLQRLYICSLASKQEDKKILNLDLLKNNSILNNKINKYPNLLIAKWLGVLYAKKDDYQNAYDLFDKASEPDKEDEFIIKLIKLSIKVLKYYTHLKIKGNENNIKANFSNEIRTEIEKLDNEVSSIKEKLDSIGLNKGILDEYENKDIFDLAFIMPFNYA